MTDPERVVTGHWVISDIFKIHFQPHKTMFTQCQGTGFRPQSEKNFAKTEKGGGPLSVPFTAQPMGGVIPRPAGLCSGRWNQRASYGGIAAGAETRR